MIFMIANGFKAMLFALLAMAITSHAVEKDDLQTFNFSQIVLMVPTVIPLTIKVFNLHIL